MLCSFDNKVEHYRVILNNNRVTVDEEEYFENLVKLVEVSVIIMSSRDRYCCVVGTCVCVALSERS